ncbi:hypothetical protein KY309_01045, partial [Candidatus Woesearchaeota archaeon]|nr:hypothetical protein [Candidatus Woesearchaeota archaeon]
SFTSLLEDYAKSVLKIDKDIVGDAVKVLFSSGPISNVSERSELLLRYIQALNSRGELDIQRGLQSFSYRRNGLDSGFVDKILALHEHYGILQFSRLQKNDGDESLIEELLKNADPDYRKDKPLAVVCVGREGAEIAFDTFSLGNFYDTLKTLSSGYRLMVYSVASESGPFDALAKARSVAGRKADLLVLAGHGSPSGVGLGGKAEDQVLDLSDSSVIRSFEPMVSESGRVVLYSCSTGAGRNNAVNIANHFAFNLPGRIVYAPDAKTTGVELRLDSAGLVDDIRFLDSERAKTGTYSVVKPR